MAIQTKRYQFKGPWPLDLKNSTDPNLVLANPGFFIAFDVTWDDAVCDPSAMDERMRHYGCFPELVDTLVTSPIPFIGIIAADDSVWKLNISILGVLTTIKVTP